MKLEFSRQIFEKHSNIKFNEIPSSGSRVVPREGTDGKTNRPTDTTQLMVAFRSFTNEPKNELTQTCKIEDRRKSSPVANFHPQIPHGRYCLDC